MSTQLNQAILGQLLEMKALDKPEHHIFTFENADSPEEKLTYRDLHENSHRVARALLDAGVDTGDRFAVMMRNHPEMLYCMAAASIVGAVMVPVDPRSRGYKLAYQVSNSKSKVVFTTSDLLPYLEAEKENMPGVGTIFTVEKPGFPAGTDDSKYPSIDEILKNPFRPVDYKINDPTHPLEIIYTSGTTGDPKGVVCDNMRLAFYSFLGNFFGYREDDILYNGLSLTHGNAQAVTFAPALSKDLTAVFSVKFSKSRLWDITRRYGITTFSLLGGMMSAIYNEPPRPDDADNPVRMVVSAGTPRAIWEAFEKRFNLKILEWYGSVEGGFAYKPVDQGPVGSFGKPVDSIMEMEIFDENDEPCPPGQVGELVTRPRGGKAKVDYLDNPEASKDKTRGGWLRTGDMAWKDEDGWFFFAYRKGGGLRRSGDFIQPDKVEKVIGEHPDVSEVAVFGIPAESGAPGESDLVAAVMPFEGADPDPGDIFNHARKGLEPNSVPSYLMFVEEIPKTISEKPQERFLKQIFEEHPEKVHKLSDYPKK